MIHETSSTNWLKKWLPLVIACLAVFITALDTNLLNVALPTMVADFHTTIKGLQWVIAAYSLVLASFMITGGRLGDLLGRKRVFMIGAALFGIGSLIAALSHSVPVLIIGESVIEGFGAALMTTTSAVLIIANYSGQARAFAFGMWTGIGSLAYAIAPLIGGFFTTNYTWRDGFLINVVIVIILLAGSVFVKESSDRQEKKQFDFIGIALSTIGLFLVVFGIIESSDYGWLRAKEIFSIGQHAVTLPGNMSIAFLAIILGLVVLVLFGFQEIHREQAGKTPLISLSIFGNWQFSGGLLTNCSQYLALGGVGFALPIFFEAIRGLSALDIGITLVPYTIMIFAGSQVSTYLGKYFRARPVMQSGYVVAIVGIILLWTEISVSTTSHTVIPGFILIGLGVGILAAQLSNITLSAVSVDQAGEASGILNTLRQLSLAVAVAIAGSIILSTLTARFMATIQKSPVLSDSQKVTVLAIAKENISEIEFGDFSRDAALSTFSDSQLQAVKDDAKESMVVAMRKKFTFDIILLIVTFFLTFTLRNRKDIELNIPAVRKHS